MSVAEITPAPSSNPELEEVIVPHFDRVGLPEAGPADHAGVIPFGAELMVQATVDTGTASPNASNRTFMPPRPTVIQTVRNNVPDQSTDQDISYDQSDPS